LNLSVASENLQQINATTDIEWLSPSFRSASRQRCRDNCASAKVDGIGGVSWVNQSFRTTICITPSSFWDNERNLDENKRFG
jgi:hypothetical protein